jgi:signal transduction histidine kinase
LQGHRAQEVVTGLRSLVRGAQLSFTKVDINEAVDEVLLLSKRELERAGITLRADSGKSLPNIEGDRVQLQQVVLNLVRNAIEAMAGVEGRSRILTITSDATNDHVCVTIGDTGTGIDPKKIQHVFDALYTTKPGGLGLGLSICRKIIILHGGRLWAKESTTQGTTFVFALPLRQSAQISGNSSECRH